MLFNIWRFAQVGNFTKSGHTLTEKVDKPLRFSIMLTHLLLLYTNLICFSTYRVKSPQKWLFHQFTRYKSLSLFGQKIDIIFKLLFFLFSLLWDSNLHSTNLCVNSFWTIFLLHLQNLLTTTTAPVRCCPTSTHPRCCWPREGPRSRWTTNYTFKMLINRDDIGGHWCLVLLWQGQFMEFSSKALPLATTEDPKVFINY